MIAEATYRGILAAYRGGNVIPNIVHQLEPLWCDDYYAAHPDAEIVSVDLKDTLSSFTYLFDIRLQRAVVAFGVPAFATHRRDPSRMAGHPLSAGSQFHRGHLMAHSIGGGTDINLVPQLGKLNVGEFRKLERQVRDLAKQNLQCLYWVRCIYNNDSQTPSNLEQCMIAPSGLLAFREFKNS
ncbi:MAG: DNA/RNA non-specific endonuclease [Terracidiphilus sp.]